MDNNELWPSIDLLRQESVLVQAWKKTAAYIRYHNWYADTLELDRAAINLPDFLKDVASRFNAHAHWASDRIRMVPAPKSQEWRVSSASGKWEPVDSNSIAAKLRPLAHVTLRDQVAATAMMLCLANRVESLQGDPRSSINDPEHRKRVISYGNRLFCDGENHILKHRWGSTKLYRSYFQDYRNFLSRPEVAAENAVAFHENGERDSNQPLDLAAAGRVVVVHSDLRQFYDRVQPSLLASKLKTLTRPGDDPEFFSLAERLFRWNWDRNDEKEVINYAKQSGLADFTQVALPQGLVAAGFFANVALLDFDQAIRASFFKNISSDVQVIDVGRYVDDLRIVLVVPEKHDLKEIERLVATWLQGLLDIHANGLEVSLDKTKAARLQGDERPLVRQSRKMERIQGAVSGGFDAIGGEAILEAVQGLIRSQQRYSEESGKSTGWRFSPIPDVRDATVSRFAAARFRTTYRSLRPLLEKAGWGGSLGVEDSSDNLQGQSRVIRTQEDLDDEARAFALGMVENWIEDPSNVRLLRIGLDLWPAPDVLASVLELLRPYTCQPGQDKAAERVAWYCLAEVMRAGATETGFVDDDESLPAGVNIKAYRAVLLEESKRLLELSPRRMPWYVRQQALLFIAANDAQQAPSRRGRDVSETAHYWELIHYMRGEVNSYRGFEFASLSILCRRSFLDRDRAIQLATRDITNRRFNEVAERDPSFALEILEIRPDLVEGISPRLRDDLSLDIRAGNQDIQSLAMVVLKEGQEKPLRNEPALLRFASMFLDELALLKDAEVITPSDVMLTVNANTHELKNVKIRLSRVSPAGSMYRPPAWCSDDQYWRFQVGYLLRFILAARPDFTLTLRPTSWKEGKSIYRVPESHWYQRLYGMFNGHSAFGDDWLPISDWVENLLFALLGWPGCRASEMVVVQLGLEATRRLIESRIAEIEQDQGPAGSVLSLRLAASRPGRTRTNRRLRACVVQTVLPMPDRDFPDPVRATMDDLKFSGPVFRRRHRNHLSAALAAVERMLDLRETHKGQDGQLDWLILPELAVHPDDVKTHLVPFARNHKTIILAGLTYEELFAGKPLVNSAIWIIPEWTNAYGMQIRTLRQGKKHLSPEEEKHNVTIAKLQGFRPCQWLVGYDWSKLKEDKPLWLTAAICYDATDLDLVADLRNRSDVLAISAFNKDVKTFDQMALALHYHMYQLVVVANNGWYGGSNAYAPYRDDYMRQIFHLHGQPQASMGFLEIEDIGAFLKRKEDAKNHVSSAKFQGASKQWKYPPAGM